MAEVAQAVVALIPSAKGFGQATQRELAGQMRGTGKKQGVGIGRRLAGGMAAGIVAAGGAGFILKSVVGEASSLEQSVGGLKAVFKGSFGEMNKESQRAAKNLGLSKNEYNELATVLGAGLKNKGIKDYADQTQGLIGVGADLAAQFGGSTQEAVDALAAAMRGESDPIERYGISLNESAISAELARKGQDDLKGAALEQAKTQARLTLISKQSADAQGAFGRESNTLAGQQQRLGAQVDNVKAKLGKALLPVLTDAASLLNDKVVPAVSTFIDEWRNSTGVGGQVRDVVMRVGSALKTVATFLWDHKEAVAALLVAYAGFKVVMATMRAYRAVMLAVKGAQLGYAAATYGAVGASMAQTRAEKLGLAVGKAKLFFTKAVTVATKAWAVAQRVLNAVLRMNPIGLVVTALTLLVGGMVLAYKKSETFRRIVDGAWRGIKKAAKAVVNWFKNTAWPWMKNAFQWIGDKAKWLWGQIRDAWNWIKGKIKSVVGWIKNVAWPWIKRAFDNIKAAAGWLWDKIKWAFDKIKGGAQSFADKIKWLRDWIKRYFQAVKANADWLWDKVKIAFNKLKDGVAAVKRAFGNAKDGIGRAWGKVYGKITSPIKKALRWLNKNFIGKLNSLLGKIPGVSFQIPKINTEGFRRGGILPGYTPMSRGDDRLTPMRSGEGVLVSEGLRDPQSKSMFLAANSAAKRGVPFKDFINQGYAGGGIVALGKRLQKMGYDVSEHPAFGGVVPGAHSASGYHYKGGALDINADPWNSRFNRETPALDRLNRMLRGEGWNTIWRAPNHWDHLHVDIGNGQGGSLGLGFLKKFLPDWAKDLADGPAKFIRGKVAGFMSGMKGGKFGLAGKVLPGMIGHAAKGLAGKVADSFSLSKLLDKFTPDWLSGGDKGGGGTDRWRGTVARALSMLGLPLSLTGTTLRRMNQESGGNPRAINNWDSNARRGTPSKGLMQVIDPTFRAYNYPGHNDIWNPLDNILASMRYALARYGSLSSAYNRAGGYSGGGIVQPAVFDNGGTLAPGLNLVHNKLGKPEALVRPEQMGSVIDYDKLARAMAKHVEPAVYRGTYDGAAQQRRNEYIGAASTPRGRRRG